MWNKLETYCETKLIEAIDDIHQGTFPAIYQVRRL